MFYKSSSKVFKKLRARNLRIYFKRDSGKGVFLLVLSNICEFLFCRQLQQLLLLNILLFFKVTPAIKYYPQPCSSDFKYFQRNHSASLANRCFQKSQTASIAWINILVIKQAMRPNRCWKFEVVAQQCSSNVIFCETW